MQGPSTKLEIRRADVRLRWISGVVLIVALFASSAVVFGFHHWLLHQANVLPPAQLIAQLRLWIGVALIGSGICILLLAGYTARLARRILEQRRWPLAETRVLRDTPIRRDAGADRVARQLNATALMLMAAAIIVGALSWRWFAATH